MCCVFHIQLIPHSPDLQRNLARSPTTRRNPPRGALSHRRARGHQGPDPTDGFASSRDQQRPRSPGSPQLWLVHPPDRRHRHQCQVLALARRLHSQSGAEEDEGRRRGIQALFNATGTRPRCIHYCGQQDAFRRSGRKRTFEGTTIIIILVFAAANFHRILMPKATVQRRASPSMPAWLVWAKSSRSCRPARRGPTFHIAIQNSRDCCKIPWAAMPSPT